MTTVFVRVKRKREEAGSETLIIEAPRSKREKGLLSAFDSLDVKGTNRKTERHCFRRLETLETAMAHSVARREDDEVCQRLVREARALRSLEEGTEETTVWAEVRSLKKRRREEEVPVVLPSEAKKKKLFRVSNPAERRMDLAILELFQAAKADEALRFGNVSRALDDGRDVGLSVDYRRPRDGTTALMAAAFIGAATCVRALLERGADASTVDFNGKTAYSLAFDRGHHEVARILQIERQKKMPAVDLDAAPEEGIVEIVVPEERDAEENLEENFVYDVYAYDSRKKSQNEVVAKKMRKDLLDDDSDSDNLSTRCLASPQLFDQMAAPLIFGIKEPLYAALSFAADSLSPLDDASSLSSADLLDGDDADSNAENHFANEYPEDEEEDDESAFDTDDTDDDEPRFGSRKQQDTYGDLNPYHDDLDDAAPLGAPGFRALKQRNAHQGSFDHDYNIDDDDDL